MDGSMDGSMGRQEEVEINTGRFHALLVTTSDTGEL